MVSKSLGCIPTFVALLSLFLSIFIYSSNHDLSISATAIAPEANSNQSIVIVPTPTVETPFVVENNHIEYRHADTMDCQVVIGGYILDIDQKFLNDVVVNIESIELENVPSAISYARPSDSSGVDNQQGWSVLLPNRTVDYQVWLSKERGSEPLSPVVIVPSQGCEKNLAVMNFVQVSPISTP